MKKTHLQNPFSTMQEQTHQMETPESYSDSQFIKSLQELKDLSSQLHYAADHSEKSYLNAKEKKKIVLKKTKDYISKAVVTVIDHVGCVSSNLDYELSKETAISEAELGIDCLNQRLIAWQQYFHKREKMKLSWIHPCPRYHSRYIIPPMQDSEKSYDVGSHVPNSNKLKKSVSFCRLEAAKEFDANGVPLLLYTVNMKTCLSNDPTSTPPVVLPVRHGISSPSAKTRNPSFHFEGSSPKVKRNILSLLLLRRSKQ